MIAALAGQKTEIDLRNIYVRNVRIIGSTLRSKAPEIKAQILSEIVEKVYPEIEKEVSFRDIIHEFTAGSEWGEFGIDLCLGSEADEPIDERKQMFAPFYMMEAARGAMIHRADTVVPLVLEEFKVVDAVLEDEPAFPLSPMTCAMGLLVATAFVVGWGIRKGRPCLAWNVLMFFLQGLGGCIVAFLFFFSLH